MKNLKTILTLMVVMACAVTGFAQKGGGMGRSGSVSPSFSRPSSTPSFSRPTQTRPTVQGTPRPGGMGRQGGVQPAVAQPRPVQPPVQSSVATPKGNMNRSGAAQTGSTNSRWVYSAPRYEVPRYHYNVGYRLNVMPARRTTIWYNGQWAYYYPEYGQIAYVSNPLVMAAAYVASQNYAPPVGYVPPDYNQTTQTTQTVQSPDGTTTTTTTTRQPGFNPVIATIVGIISVILLVSLVIAVAAVATKRL